MATTTSNCNNAHNGCCNGQHVCVSPCRPVQNIKTKVIKQTQNTGEEGNGISDAPADGNTYGRKDGIWQILQILELGETEGTAYEGSKGKQNANDIALLKQEKVDKVKVVDGGSGDVVITISPNVFYMFGECTRLVLTLAAGEEGLLNEYMLQFTSGETETTLSLPSDIRWIGNNTVEAGKTYQLSIVNNIAVIGGI